MRLSDAIATGRVLIKNPNSMDYCRCAIGMAAASISGEQFTKGSDARKTVWDLWPWILEHRFNVKGSGPGDFSADWVISYQFFLVREGKQTLDQLIDWVRSVEPAEPVETPVVEQEEVVAYA